MSFYIEIVYKKIYIFFIKVFEHIIQSAIVVHIFRVDTGYFLIPGVGISDSIDKYKELFSILIIRM